MVAVKTKSLVHLLALALLTLLFASGCATTSYQDYLADYLTQRFDLDNATYKETLAAMDRVIIVGADPESRAALTEADKVELAAAFANLTELIRSGHIPSLHLAGLALLSYHTGAGDVSDIDGSQVTDLREIAEDTDSTVSITSFYTASIAFFRTAARHGFQPSIDILQRLGEEIPTDSISPSAEPLPQEEGSDISTSDSWPLIRAISVAVITAGIGYAISAASTPDIPEMQTMPPQGCP
jgi:hypothetical protein